MDAKYEKGKRFITIDLEFTQPSQRIIEVGAVVGDLSTGKILEEFTQFVNPHEPLTEYICKLTSITDNDLVSAGTLSDAYEKLKLLCTKYSVECNPITWGGDDARALRAELGEHSTDWPFGYRIIDTKTLFQIRQLALGAKTQAGLAKAMVKCGLRFRGTKHRAVDDARNTWDLFYYLFRTYANA